MKKTLLSLITIILFALTINAQSYTGYMGQGKSFYKQQQYLTALERFDLAYEFAKTDTEKSNAKNWKNKSRKEIRKQQYELKLSLSKTDSLLELANVRYQNTNKILISLLPQLPDNEEEVSDYLVKSADSLFYKGLYSKAIKWYELAELSAKNEIINEILSKKKNANLCIKLKSKGIDHFYGMDYKIAKSSFDSILVINPNEQFALRMSSFCLHPGKRKYDFVKVKSRDSVKKQVCRHLITNIEMFRFIQEYGGNVFKQGKLQGKQFASGSYRVESGSELKAATNISWNGVMEFCSFYGVELITSSEIKSVSNNLNKTAYTEWCKEESINNGLISNSRGRMWFYHPNYMGSHIGFRYAIKK